MSIEHDIAAAQNPREALIILGHALDRIEEKLDVQALTADMAATMGQVDPWSEWTNTSPLPPTAGDIIRPIDIANAEKAAEIEAALAEARDDEEINALQAKLRLAKDTGRSIEPPVEEGARPTIASDGTTGDVELVAASPQRRRARMQWAMGIGLHEYIPLSAHDAAVAFAAGGPQWLYLGNREAVMQMPYAARQWLVEEVAQDSPAAAQEMGRDILKSTQSADKDITIQAIEGLSASRG